jgi:hypothetical protein
MITAPRQIKFFGRVHPSGLKLSIDRQPPINFIESNGLFQAEYNISIINSSIEIVCYFDNVTPAHPYELWQQGIMIVTGLVDLMAFQMGVGAVTVLDKWVNEDGVEDNLALGDPLLMPVCTSFGQDQRFGIVSNLLLAEPAIFSALNDLILTNVIASQTLINAARSVETIRVLIAGPSYNSDERKKAWNLMQQVLNLNQAYVTFITQPSIDPRHGNQVPTAPQHVHEVRLRAWKIMDRFFHYRLRGNDPLPQVWFPTLLG